MADVNGIFNRRTVFDTRGRTNNSVGGYGNTVDFRGDRGRNTFDIGGAANNVQVHNLGRDDTVNLQGPGWQEVADANSRDGVVRYYNQLTGSYAEVHTDGGRNDEFVRNRVNGANNMAMCGCWGNLGHAAGWMQGYNQGRQQGYNHGYQQGRQQGSYDFGFNLGNWMASQVLGPLAWAF